MGQRPGRDAILEQFALDGMTTMFGNPGTVEQGFIDATERHPAFRYVLGLQESAVVGMADGYARGGARPALVQLHTGVGLGNGIGMLYQAKRGHSPLVVVAGDAGVRYDAMDAQMAAELVAMARPVTKHAERVTHPDSVLRVLRRAVKVAMTPPRGPVFVALPMDVLDQPTGEPALPTVLPSRAVLPVDADLDRAAAALVGARSCVILMGDGVAVSGAQAELTRVAELLDAQVWGLDHSEVNMDTTHPLYAGQLGHMFGEVSAARVAEADAVLIVGTYPFPEVFPALESPFRQDARVVHIDLDDWEMAKNFPVDVGLIADPKPTLAALADRLAERSAPAPAPAGVWSRPALTQDSPMMERFAAELAARAPAGTIVFDEALTASADLVRQFPPRNPGEYFTTRGGSLGVGIPGAIGVKLARPEAEVIGFTGDGGSMYTFQALWTAARHGIAAKFVICNNRRYELLDLNIEQYFSAQGIPSHQHPSSFDLSTPEIGFSELARSLGVPATRVRRPEEIAPAIRRMLAEPGPFLVDLWTV